MSFWDFRNKKRLAQTRTCSQHTLWVSLSLICAGKYPASISALAFNPDGTRLAIASSYAYEEGEAEHAPDQIFIRNVRSKEILPKKRSKK